MAQGWECPKCGRCYAPTVTQCSGCVGVSPAVPYAQPYVLPYVPYQPVLPMGIGPAVCSAYGKWYYGNHTCWTATSGSYTPPEWMRNGRVYLSNGANEVVNG